jgi:hypothetical protein
MSLLRLLTSGRCLVGLKDSASQYRIRRQNLLPKFSSSNPFLVRAQTAKPAESDPPVTTWAPAQSASPDRQSEASSAELQPLPDSTAATAVPTHPAERESSPSRAEAGAVVRFAQKLRRWAGNRNPFSRRASVRPAGKPGSAIASRSPVQGELSLENIRVVRNDLSEADVEVVPATSSRRKESASRTEAGEEAELAATERH